MTARDLEIVRLEESRIDGLLAMLQAIADEGMTRWFEPHPFTRDHLSSLCADGVSDLYYVMSAGPEVLGYGLLRGWDEGYPVPSLGIAVHPAHRGKGFGLTMMEFLHAAARLRGSEQVRLRVYDNNDAAIALYRRLGYRFDNLAGGSGQPVVGFKRLVP